MSAVISQGATLRRYIIGLRAGMACLWEGKGWAPRQRTRLRDVYGVCAVCGFGPATAVRSGAAGGVRLAVPVSSTCIGIPSSTVAGRALAVRRALVDLLVVVRPERGGRGPAPRATRDATRRARLVF